MQPNLQMEFAVFKWIFKAMATTPAQTQLLLWTIKDLSNHGAYTWKSTCSTLPRPKKPHSHPAKYLGNTPAMCVPIMNSFSSLLRLLCIFYKPMLLLTYTALTGKKKEKKKKKEFSCYIKGPVYYTWKPPSQKQAPKSHRTYAYKT